MSFVATTARSASRLSSSHPFLLTRIGRGQTIVLPRSQLLESSYKSEPASSYRRFSTPRPPPPPKAKSGGANGLLWQVGVGASVVAAYFAANYFIFKTNESINEDGEFVTGGDGPGT